MVYLAFIFHMHQPYYKNLLTNETEAPWVRLHGIKDYLDMVEMLARYPAVHQTFNLVPSLIEQLEDYTNGTIKDKYLELTIKPAAELTDHDKDFLLANFFSINKDKVISFFPRYYELYLKRASRKPFSTQDFLDLQVWFNLAWFDPSFRERYVELSDLMKKARFFQEEDKSGLLRMQTDILKQIIPAYKESMSRGQIEATVTPFYHPILPLLFSTNIAKEANTRAVLPNKVFSHPQDALAQIESAVSFYRQRLGVAAAGMWPSEEAVCDHIIPFFIQAGIQWIVADEAILFKSLKKRKRDAALLYQPHLIEKDEGRLQVVFRDRNLSDLIGFEYHRWNTEDAVNDFLKHLENIHAAFKDKDVLVTIAMDGENAWEYYRNDGHDFLELLYQRLSDAKTIKTVTVSEYLKMHPPTRKLPRISAGSWINGDFSKWIGNGHKIKAWEYLADAREELSRVLESGAEPEESKALLWKQMHILEGSDWFWWAGEDYPGYFDRLYRMHLANLYRLLKKEVPEHLKKPIEP